MLIHIFINQKHDYTRSDDVTDMCILDYTRNSDHIYSNSITSPFLNKINVSICDLHVTQLNIQMNQIKCFYRKTISLHCHKYCN